MSSPSAGPTLWCWYHLSRCTISCLQGATGHNLLLHCGLHPGRQTVIQVVNKWWYSIKVRLSLCAQVRLIRGGTEVSFASVETYSYSFRIHVCYSPGYSAALPWVYCKWAHCLPLCPWPTDRPSPPSALPQISSSSSAVPPKHNICNVDIYPNYGTGMHLEIVSLLLLESGSLTQRWIIIGHQDSDSLQKQQVLPIELHFVI